MGGGGGYNIVGAVGDEELGIGLPGLVLILGRTTLEPAVPPDPVCIFMDKVLNYNLEDAAG